MGFGAGVKYAKSHEYASVDGDTAIVGISDFAQVLNDELAWNLNWGGMSASDTCVNVPMCLVVLIEINVEASSCLRKIVLNGVS